MRTATLGSRRTQAQSRAVESVLSLFLTVMQYRNADRVQHCNSKRLATVVFLNTRGQFSGKMLIEIDDGKQKMRWLVAFDTITEEEESYAGMHGSHKSYGWHMLACREVLEEE